MLCQVQFNLSLRRRYLMRPFLKQKYSGVCNINVPITSYLFGDDVSNELKKCETSYKVGKYSSITKSSSFGPIRGRRSYTTGNQRWRQKPYIRGPGAGWTLGQKTSDVQHSEEGRTFGF